MSNVFVISAPSGTGKSSIVKELCKLDKHITISISHTTRKARINEKDGTDYFFINNELFQKMIKNNEFLEYAHVYDNYYGTNIDSIKKMQDDGFDIILEIDWQGAMQIKKHMPNAILIYIKPPSIEELAKRLTQRNTDSEEIINKRLNLASADLSHSYKFDYIIINDKFDHAVQQIYSIILEHRT